LAEHFLLLPPAVGACDSCAFISAWRVVDQFIFLMLGKEQKEGGHGKKSTLLLSYPLCHESWVFESHFEE
jgi:hypothetical protein